MAVKKTGESKVKKVVGGIACALALILVGGVCGGLLQHHYNWGAEEKPPVEDSTGGEEKPEDSGGGEVSTEAGVSHGIRLAAMKLASSEYEAYGVSAQAETAYTLTATITPADAANKALDWSVSFTDAGDEWATGKTVTDYVTVTPSADGALTAVVENIAAFGEQITVKATSRENTSAYATCTVEYMQRTVGYQAAILPSGGGAPLFTMGANTSNVSGCEVEVNRLLSRKAQVQLTAIKSPVYTRANTDKATYYALKPTDSFKTVFSGDMMVSLAEFTGTAGENGVCPEINFFGSEWWSSNFGPTPSRYNGNITKISSYSGVAYELLVYDNQGGTELAKFDVTFDASVLVGQKVVDSLVLDETEIVF